MVTEGEKAVMYKGEEKKFDVRVVEKYIQEGSITRPQFKIYLKKLTDVSANIDEEYHSESFPARKKVPAGSPPSQVAEGTATQKDEKEP